MPRPLHLVVSLVLALTACNLDYEVPDPSDAADTDAETTAPICATQPCGAQTCCEIDDVPVCIDTMSDDDHCGACGEKCGKDEVCRRGRCEEED